jgi:hypothetical protein
MKLNSDPSVGLGHTPHHHRELDLTWAFSRFEGNQFMLQLLLVFIPSSTVYSTPSERVNTTSKTGKN